MVGTMMDEAYLDTTLIGVRSSVFANEWLGFEVQMSQTNVKDSDDRRALNNIRFPVPPESGDAVPEGTTVQTFVSTDQEVNAIHFMTNFNVIAAPFYGKLNLLNKWIVYTDLYVTGGVSRVDTDKGDKSSFTLGGGERFYIGKSWSVRIDFKDRIFKETRAGKETTKHSKSIDFGASYFFN